MTIICILGYVGVVFSFPAVFSPSVKKMGEWYPALFGLLVASTFISYIGVWHMKRWGVQLFALAFFSKLSVQILTSDVSWAGAAASVLFLCGMLPFYRKMDTNL